MRLDCYLVDVGLAPSRNKAQQMISLGKVEVNGKVVEKASYAITESDDVRLLAGMEFVSMGGFKLERAITEFGLDIHGAVAIDVGASNGGFTHCMLMHGAEKVYAVDVGECALEQEILSDERVVVRDRLNAREMTIDDIGEKVDFISIDVSFISLKYILYNVTRLLKEDGRIVALIKPQFEAGRKALSKSGIVTDKKVHIKVIADIVEHIHGLNLSVTRLTNAPIREGKNVEYLILIARKGKSIDMSDISSVVYSAK